MYVYLWLRNRWHTQIKCHWLGCPRCWTITWSWEQLLLQVLVFSHSFRTGGEFRTVSMGAGLCSGEQTTWFTSETWQTQAAECGYCWQSEVYCSLICTLSQFGFSLPPDEILCSALLHKHSTSQFSFAAAHCSPRTAIFEGLFNIQHFLLDYNDVMLFRRFIGMWRKSSATILREVLFHYLSVTKEVPPFILMFPKTQSWDGPWNLLTQMRCVSIAIWLHLSKVLQLPFLRF